MYLLSQLAFYLFLTFLLGIGVGYALWRAWGEREAVAKFNAAEMRLAAHLARREKAAAQPDFGGRDGSKAARGLGEQESPSDGTRAPEMRWEEAAKRKLNEI